MSLILDALRKMEQERKSRRGAAQDLRPEVLRYRTAALPKQPPNYPLFIAGALLLCAGVGAGFLIKGSGAKSVEAQAPAAAPSAPAALPAPPPAPPAAAAAPVAVPVPMEQTAAPIKPAEPSPAPFEVSKTKRQRVAASGPAATIPAEPAPVPQARPLLENPVQVHAGNDIVISGIAYQDERRLRRAVLNGQLVGEGAEIAGARVVEIRETKVRFSRGGRLFDVPFSSGLQSR